MRPTQHAVTVQPIALGAVSAQSMRVRAGLGTIGELYRSFVENGRWWMVPMIAILGLTSLLLIAIAAIEYVAPFVYALF